MILGTQNPLRNPWLLLHVTLIKTNRRDMAIQPVFFGGGLRLGGKLGISPDVFGFCVMLYDFIF